MTGMLPVRRLGRANGSVQVAQPVLLLLPGTRCGPSSFYVYPPPYCQNHSLVSLYTHMNLKPSHNARLQLHSFSSSE